MSFTTQINSCARRFADEIETHATSTFANHTEFTEFPHRKLRE